MNDKLFIPDEFTLPDDLVNVGRRCGDCGSVKVVYHISVPDPPHFNQGPLCFKCLVQRCGSAHKIPVPMEVNLRDSIFMALGLDPKHPIYMMPG